MALREWVKLPSKWIEDGGLCLLQWNADEKSGSACVAALMLLAVIAHWAEEETGLAKVSYGEFCARTGLSRAMVSAGLKILVELQVIDRLTAGRSTIQLTHYSATSERWCKLPAKPLYRSDHIPVFYDFSLRKAAELNALKLYFLFAARRGEDTNLANISYDKITEYAGLDRARIKTALSVLAAHGLVHIEHIPSLRSEYGIANAYRLAHVKSRHHMGTFGRSMDTDFEPA